MNYQELAKEFGGSADVGTDNTAPLIDELDPIKKAETSAPVDYNLMAQEFGGVVEGKETPEPPVTPPAPTVVNEPTGAFPERLASDYSGQPDFNNLSLQNPPKPVDPNQSWYGSTKEFIHELFTADKRKIGGLEGLRSFEEMPFQESKIFGIPTGLSVGLRREKAALGGMQAGSPKELADIYSEQLGRNPETGNYSQRKTIGSYELIWNPHDEKWYADKPGLRLGDVKKVVGTVGLEAMTGQTVKSLATKIPSIASKINKIKNITKGTPLDKGTVLGAVTKEAAIQGVHETIQEATGGDASVVDMSIAGGIGGVTRLAGKAKEAFTSSNANKKAIINANTNGGFAELRKLHKDNPESLNASLKEYGFKEYDPKKGLVLDRDIDIAIQDLSKSKNKDYQQLANAMATDPEVVKAAKESGLLDLLTTREITSRKDFRTTELLDSISTEATSEGSMAGRMGHNKQELTDRIVSKMDAINKSKDVGAMSDDIKEVMIAKKEGYEEQYDALYTKLKEHIPDDLTFNAEKTLAYLNQKIDAFRPRVVPNGYVLKDGSKVANPLDVLSPTERDIYKKLSPREYEYKPANTGTVVGSQKTVEGAPVRTVVGSQKVAQGDPSRTIVGSQNTVEGAPTRTVVGDKIVVGKGDSEIVEGGSRTITGKGEDELVEGGSRTITGKGKSELVEGESKLSKSGDARNVDITGKGKPDITHDARYSSIDQLRKDVGGKIKSLNVKDSENADFKKLYRLLTEDQDNAIKSIGDDGSEVSKIWKEAKDLVALDKSTDDDMARLFGKAFDEDFVQKLSSSMEQAGKGSTHKFMKMIKAIPEEKRKDFISSAMLYSLKDKNGIIEFDKFGNWWSQIKNNSTAMNLLSEPENMNPEAFKLVKNLGVISQAIHRTGKDKTKGVTNAIFKDVVIPKNNLITNVVNSGMVGIGAGGISALAGLGLGGIGGVGSFAFSMSVLNGLRKTIAGDADKMFKNTVDIIGSSDFKNFMASAGKTKDLRNLSASKKMMEWAKQAGIAKNRSELEAWITRSFRASNDVGKEEYESNKDLQQP